MRCWAAKISHTRQDGEKKKLATTMFDCSTIPYHYMDAKAAVD